MDIVFQTHRAVVSDSVRLRAEAAVTKLTERVRRAVAATVRFETDGPTRRVEIVLRAPRRRDIVAEGEGRAFGAALTRAVARLRAQLTKTAAARPRPRRAARA